MKRSPKREGLSPSRLRELSASGTDGLIAVAHIVVDFIEQPDKCEPFGCAWRKALACGDVEFVEQLY